MVRKVALATGRRALSSVSFTELRSSPISQRHGARVPGDELLVPCAVAEGARGRRLGQGC